MEDKALNKVDSMTEVGSLIALVLRCKDRDEAAMETMYFKYKSSLFNLCYRFVGSRSHAEDLLQEIFIQIFRQVPKLRAMEAFNSWLYRIAVNTCIDFVRKNARLKEVPLEENPERGKAPVIRIWKHDLKQAIKTLPPKQRMVFLLHDVQGFTHQEIAGIMRSRQGTCKSQLFKARMKLKDYLSE